MATGAHARDLLQRLVAAVAHEGPFDLFQ